MRVLITGSSGQLDTNLTPRLLAKGGAIFSVDCTPSSTREHYEHTAHSLDCGPARGLPVTASPHEGYRANIGRKVSS